MTDPERQYAWRSLGRTNQGQTCIAALTIGGREFAYEYHRDYQDDEDQPWYKISFGLFGSSIAGRIQHGVEPHVFTTDAEREHAVLIAIEATLAWEPSSYALERPDGYNRAKFKGVEYRLSDFGPYFDTVPSKAEDGPS